MFDPSSRYYNLATALYQDETGRRIAYKRRRFLPQGDRLPLMTQVTVADGDRLDLIAARTIGAPEQFWRIADANNALNPRGVPWLGSPEVLEQTPADAMAAGTAEDLQVLSAEDRVAAKKQRICPVTGALLGSMGEPYKLEVKNRTVFLCCEGCKGLILQDPDKYLAKLERTPAEK